MVFSPLPLFCYLSFFVFFFSLHPAFLFSGSQGWVGARGAGGEPKPPAFPQLK